MSRDPGLDFSFSGLKTALAYLCRDLGPEGVEERRADLAASFQAAAVGQLTAKLERALKRGEWGAVALGGGVAANGPLREAVADALRAARRRAEAGAARALHRQRGDDRLRRPLRPPTPVPRLPLLRRLPDARRRPRDRGHRLLAARAAISARRRSRRSSPSTARAREFELHEVDIESEELLLRRMLERIPVVEVDGDVVSELSLDADRASRPARYCGCR